MRAYRLKWIVYWVVSLAVLGTSGLWAQDEQKQPTAHQVVEHTTEQVMELITEAQGYFNEDPERFYREIDKVLEEVVDFDSFARGVMGKYASKRMYLSLSSEEEKKQFIANMKRFSETPIVAPRVVRKSCDQILEHVDRDL